MLSQFTPAIQSIYQIFEKIDFSECNDCSECCHLSWLLKEEYDLHLNNFNKSIKEINSVSFIMNLDKCQFARDNRCHLYSERPLDCRLFPLDIIEEDGVYWWCIFTICPKHEKIREKLIALIPKIENLITKDIFEQYKRQIILTKEIYLPCKNKQYEKIKKFTLKSS